MAQLKEGQYKESRLRLSRTKCLLAGVGLLGLLAFSADTNPETAKQLDIFATIYRELNLNYVDPVSPGELVKAASEAMLSSLDPYTEYIPEASVEDFKSAFLSGEYGGVGILVMQRDSTIIIADLFEGSPAHKGGIRIGEQLLAINNIAVKGMTAEDVSRLMDEKKGTAFTFRVLAPRATRPVDKVVVSQSISLPSVAYAGIIAKQTGYIRLDQFLDGSATEVKNAFTILKQKHRINKLVLDLRSNGGGVLQEAVRIVDFFIAKGEPVVTQKGKGEEDVYAYHAGSQPLDGQIPIIVLIDGQTASAAEIVAGALQDLDRAVIIGRPSFGKGLVQQTKEMPYNTLLKLTVGKYYTPSGRCIQRIDYLHKKQSGKESVAVDIADSLIRAFKTKNGRVVHDGRGIMPDVFVKPRKAPLILPALADSFVFFDYATAYDLEHKHIPDAGSFRLRDKEYVDFMKQIDISKLDFNSPSDDLLNKLQSEIKKAKMSAVLQSEFDALKKAVLQSRKDNLTDYKEDISSVLEEEIIARRYYQRGRIQSSLKYDDVLKKALDVLAAKTIYADILAGEGKYHVVGQGSFAENSPAKGVD